ncbi:MAG: LemA family protein [Candidatus Diapherotrites archaeon]|uniref:LemA family protein n=1 Tax=Candidatus Iainarchaeum sp. TaxID=3101447 RepID=A0A7J4ITZ0_9ARCH|nr:MAG: LemA protein [archaeon GW2011_AR10]MBS3059446.1 LemA family protein [Candidatus Diapherotrites archaeon]HIH08953.1 LemA family protein [Candidatus Diapherotrites archaeon]
MVWEFLLIGAVVLGLIGLAVIAYIILIYNSLVQLRNNIDKSWANIDVLLTQRASELPKLLDTVKGYMKYEKNVLTEVTRARTAFMDAKSIQEKADADNFLTGALKTLFAVAENYPNLKANENFMQLQGRISGLENEIADRREFYNDSVNTFNIRIQQIPQNFIAGMLGYQRKELFQATAEETKDVKINFE